MKIEMMLQAISDVQENVLDTGIVVVSHPEGMYLITDAHGELYTAKDESAKLVLSLWSKEVTLMTRAELQERLKSLLRVGYTDVDLELPDHKIRPIEHCNLCGRHGTLLIEMCEL